MEINQTNDQSGKWGAAFRNKPIFLMNIKQSRAFFEGKIRKDMVLWEDTCTLLGNDIYRDRHTSYEVPDRDKGSAFLDLGFLIQDETSCLKGSLSHGTDVDFYNFSIPYNRTVQNYFNIEVRMDLPKGCDYSLTLYDEYGNQVGRGEWKKEGQKALSIPNWDTKTSKYCIKIENEKGEEVSPDDFYKISFHVSENKEQEKTDAIREAFGALQNAYSRKEENWREYLDRYNEILKETEKNYIRERELLHQKQFESLPPEKQYKGEKTVTELLQDMAEGKSLSDAESEYVKIFANLKDYERAQQRAELKNDFSGKFVKEMEERGISSKDAEEMCVMIGSDGTVTVEGIEDEEIKEQMEKLVKKYGDRLYRYYTGIAGSVADLPSVVYQYAADVQEVRRYLRGVTGKDITLENLYFLPNGKIGGLPDKAAKLINDGKDNAKIDRIRDALVNIIGNNRIGGDIGIPDFTSQFRFRGGEFFVTDSGFAVDMEALSERMTPGSNGNMHSDMYRYQFQKVL